MIPLRRKHGLLFSVSHRIVSKPHAAIPLLRCSSGRVSKVGDGTFFFFFYKIQAFYCIAWKHSSCVTCKGPVEENLTHILFKSSTETQIWGC